MPERLDIISQLGVKIVLISMNVGMLIFINISEALTIIDKGGLMAFLIILCYVLWKIVKKQSDTIKDLNDKIIEDLKKRLEEK